MIKHIKPLPISEEMLGAYLEGNLVQSDAQYVELMLQDNDELSAFVEELSVSDNMTSNYLLEDIPNLENDFTLPEISTELGTYIELHAPPFGFEPSFADVAACAIVPEIMNSGDDSDVDFNDNMPISSDIDEFEPDFITHEENCVSNDSLLDSDFSLDMDTFNNEDLIDDNYFDI